MKNRIRPSVKKKIVACIIAFGIASAVPATLTDLGFVLEHHAATNAAQWKKTTFTVDSPKVVQLPNKDAGAVGTYVLDHKTYSGVIDTQSEPDYGTKFFKLAPGTQTQVFANTKSQIYNYGIDGPVVKFAPGMVLLDVIGSVVVYFFAALGAADYCDQLNKRRRKDHV